MSTCSPHSLVLPYVSWLFQDEPWKTQGCFVSRRLGNKKKRKKLFLLGKTYLRRTIQVRLWAARVSFSSRWIEAALFDVSIKYCAGTLIEKIKAKVRD